MICNDLYGFAEFTETPQVIFVFVLTEDHDEISEIRSANMRKKERCSL